MEDLSSLVITKLSAKDLEDIRLFGRMKVYAKASITGGPSTSPRSEYSTSIDYKRKTNPKWKSTRMVFKLHLPSLRSKRLYLNIELHCSRTIGDKQVGRVRIPVKSLLNRASNNNNSNKTNTNAQAVKYPVKTASGGNQGFVRFSYAFDQTVGGQQSFSQWPRPEGPSSVTGQYPDPCFQSQFDFSLQPQGQVPANMGVDPFSNESLSCTNHYQSNYNFMGDEYDDEEDGGDEGESEDDSGDDGDDCGDDNDSGDDDCGDDDDSGDDGDDCGDGDDDDDGVEDSGDIWDFSF